jgi:hypothetical protein
MRARARAYLIDAERRCIQICVPFVFPSSADLADLADLILRPRSASIASSTLAS